MAYKTLNLSKASFGVSESWATDGEVVSNFGGGFYNVLNIGNPGGLRSWNVKFGVLNESKFLTNDSLTQSEILYLYNFFREHKWSGEPFIMTSPVNGQKFHAWFFESAITLEKFTFKLWTTGLNIRQVRVSGQTAYDPSALAPAMHYKPDGMNIAGNFWTDLSGNGRTLVATGTQPVYSAGAQNGYPAFVWDTTRAPLAVPGTFSYNFVHAFIVAKFGSGTFPNTGGQNDYPGLITETSGNGFLVGNRADTKFFNSNFSSGRTLEYRYNGKLVNSPYESNQTAPMTKFALVELSFTGGSSLAANSFQVGQDRANTDRRGAWSVCEIIVFSSEKSAVDRQDLTEHLLTKYAL